MSNKVLVTYASRAGSTIGVAQAIAKTLVNSGTEVDVLSMQEAHDLSSYRAVIAGSAIRMDNWLPEALQFVKQHQHELSQRPFAAFLVCLAISVQDEKRLARAKLTASSYLKPVRELVPTLSEGLFAGVLDLSKLPLRYRLAFVVPLRLELFKEGDYRNWDAIRAWANEVAVKIG